MGEGSCGRTWVTGKGRDSERESESERGAPVRRVPVLRVLFLRLYYPTPRRLPRLRRGIEKVAAHFRRTPSPRPADIVPICHLLVSPRRPSNTKQHQATPSNTNILHQYPLRGPMPTQPVLPASLSAQAVDFALPDSRAPDSRASLWHLVPLAPIRNLPQRKFLCR